MPASFAAAASPSMFAPFSVGCRTLMIDANPIFLISGTAAAVVAPPHATVVSSRAKFVTPGTDCFVTCCARSGTAVARRAIRTGTCKRMRELLLRSASSSYERARVCGLLFFDGHGHRLLDADGERRAGLEHDRAAIAGGDGGRSRAGAGRRADGRAFRAAEDGADDRAAHGAAADLRGAAVSGRVAFTEDRFGVHRDARAIGEHECVEADAESRALLELAAALDE